MLLWVKGSMDLCFHCAKFEVNKQFKQLPGEKQFLPCWTKQLYITGSALV